VHCAGDGKVEFINDINFTEADMTFRLNVVWPLALTSWLFDLIKKNEADVLSVVATIGLKWYQHMTAYSAAKWGQTWLVENLQIELKWTKSRVIGVYPWGMQTTSNVGEHWRDTQLRKITNKESSGNMLDPKEIAKIIFDIYTLPKNIEVSEIIINRK
jgi:NADP-dependent 3-hydroxy acid dehydrogenase YdfG